MSTVIFFIKNYENEDVVHNLVNYIVSSPYIEYVGQAGCFMNVSRDIAEGISNSFMAVKKALYQTGGQLVQHIILGFDSEDWISENAACIIADTVALYYLKQGFQAFWGVHFGSDHSESYLHIHIALNTVNWMNGTRFKVTFETMGMLKEFLNQKFPDLGWQCKVKSSYFNQAY